MQDAAKPTSVASEDAEAWGRRLAEKVKAVLEAHPEADPDNVRHTLILLEMPPLERLQRSLIRGRAAAVKSRRRSQ